LNPPDKTLETANTAVQTESYEEMAIGTQTEPIAIQLVIMQKEKHVIFIDIAT